MKRHFVWLVLALIALWGHAIAWPALATRPTQASANGTQPFALVKDINTTAQQRSGLSSPTIFGTVNNRLLFSAFTQQMGGELWGTDGTPDGTQLVKDILPAREARLTLITKFRLS